MMRRAGALLTLALLAVTGASAQAPAAGRPNLRADGGRFALTLADGSVRTSADLVGASLTLANGRQLRIDAVHRQSDPNGRDLWLHSLSQNDGNGSWKPFCQAHADGTRLALVVAGREHADGTLAPDPEGIVITCTAGAQGKCLRFGYRPWDQGYDDYNACIRMVRADYGGDGQPYTVDGMTIDLYDDAGIQKPDHLPQHDFEAGWSPNGAVCVHHVRVAANTTLAQLQARYPALRARTGAACTEALARSLGARVFNRSDPSGHVPSRDAPSPVAK